MLSEIGRKFRDFLTGGKNDGPAKSRKRSFDTDDDIAPSPAKRRKADPADSTAVPTSGWLASVPLAKVTDWLSRGKCALSDNFYVQQLASSPKRFADRITKMSRQTSRTSIDDRRQRMDNTSRDHRADAYSPGVVAGMSRMETSHMPPPPAYAHSTPRVPYPMGYSFGEPRFNDFMPSTYNFNSQPGIPRFSSFKGVPGPPPNRTVSPPSNRMPFGQHNHNGHPPTLTHTRPSKPFGPKQTRYHFKGPRGRSKMAAKESIRLDERHQYAALLQHFTASPLVNSRLGTGYNRRPTYRREPRVNETALGITVPLPTPIKESPSQKRAESSTPAVRISSTPVQHGSHGNKRPGLTPRAFLKLQARRARQKGDSGPSQTASHDHDSSDEVIILDDKSTPRCSRVSSGVEPAKPSSVKSTSPELIKSQQKITSPCQISDEFEQLCQKSKYISEDWLEEIKQHFSPEARSKRREREELEVKTQYFKEKREEWEEQIERRIRTRLSLAEKEPPVLEESSYEESESEGEDEFPELTDEQEDMIDRALCPQPSGQILADAFKLQITRKDIATLGGLNWLNDEVINFYMNLLMERGSQEGGSKVHAFNTFFYPKIMSNGHAGVRRWTKRIDLFSMDYILIPVHLGMHWCLAAIDLKKKEIRYYDSMGGNNDRCLSALKQYLEDESMDKKSQPYDTSDWKLFNVKDIPQQMNGSDCGMFSCKFAEYITRDGTINFSQSHMPYFRRRMVLEILEKRLLV